MKGWRKWATFAGGLIAVAGALITIARFIDAQGLETSEIAAGDDLDEA